MKKFLILTTHYALKHDHSWLVDKLAEELSKESVVKVVFLDWKGEAENKIYKKNGVEIYAHNLKILQGGGFLKKSLKWFFSGDICYCFYKKEVFQEEYDCVIAFAPVVVYGRILRKLKSKTNSKFYLILWDFFPDYHSQLGLINKKLNFLFDFLEQRVYKVFNTIGLMSPGNLDYFKKNKKIIPGQRLEVLPLWGPEVPFEPFNIKNKNSIKDSRKFVFGGQLIKGRGLDVLLDLACYSIDNKREAVFYIFGDGPERGDLEKKIADSNLKNIIIKGFVPRNDYFDFLLNADVGLVFNSGHVTVPTYPSKAIDFYRSGLPILAYVESCTDFGEILEEEIGAGFYSTPKNKNKLFEKFDQLMTMSREDLFNMGYKGREYFDANLRVDHIALKLYNSIEDA